jgi:hypothetical protein
MGDWRQVGRAACVLACPIFWLATVAAFAQTTAGTIRGTVTDPAGAVVPDCDVRLLDTGTNIVRRGVCGPDGRYAFLSAPPGSYELIVEKPGFRRWSGRLEVLVQQVAVVDPTLAVGDLSETIRVTDAAPIVARETTSVGTVIDSRRIRQLPLNGRDITALLQLTAGVEGESAPRVNGLKAGSVDFSHDGSSIVNRFGGGAPRVRPGLETIQEFRVEANASAEFSRPATVTIVSRSGTNTLSGSLFETHRSNAAGLRARRREETGPPAHFVRNEFGGSAGGPLVWPRVYNGRDRSFWFFSYEGERRRESVIRAARVPTEAMWNGDFSGLVDAQGRLWQIYDPLTTGAGGSRQPFPGNRIPASRLGGPLVEFLRSQTPRPTTPVSPGAGPNWVGPFPEVLDKNALMARLDHRITERDALIGRYTRGTLDSHGYICCDIGPPAPDLAFNVQRAPLHLQDAAITYRRTLSPSAVNELVLSGHRSAQRAGGGRDDVKWTERLGLPNPFEELGWPTMDAFGEGDAYFIWDSQNKKLEFLNALAIENSFTWLRSSHELKFGFKGRDERNNIAENQQGQGLHSFENGWTGLYDAANGLPAPFTGSGLASLLLGYGTYYSNQYNRGFFYFRQREYGAYAQDTWRISPRLTATYGLRYDLWTPYREARGRLMALDMSRFRTTRQVITPAGHPMEQLGVPPSVLASYAAAGLTWTTADAAGFPKSLLRADRNNVGPRAALAFAVNDRTVVRGAYGLYYWTMPLSQILQSARLNAPLNLRYETRINDLDGEDYFPFRSRPVPGLRAGDPMMVDVNSAQTVRPPFAFAPWDKDWRDARAQVWHVTLEREVLPLTRARISYVGTRADSLEQRLDLNTPESQYLYALRTGDAPPSANARRPNPFWNDLPATNRTGYSDSHSVHVELQRRYSRGLAFQGFYAWSRHKSTSDGDGFVADAGQPVPAPQTVPGARSYGDLLKMVYSNLASVPKHRVRWNALYELPFGRGRAIGASVPGALNQAIGGWQIAAIGTFGTGTWLSTAPEWFVTGDPRLEKSARRRFMLDGKPVLLYFRGAFDATGISGLERYEPALVQLGPGHDNLVEVGLRDGTTRLIPYDIHNPAPRNSIEGPKTWNVDLSVFKDFPLGGGATLRVTADAFNALNHANDIDPDPVTGLIDLSRQRNEPRTIQLSARIEF